MRTIDIARRMAELDQKEDAQKAYLLALREAEGKNPEEEMEAASYIFFSEGNYQVSYTTFISLYNRGFYQNELMDLMMQAFYLPNREKQRKQYLQNCTYLSRYTYCFHDSFCDFDELSILFFPFDDNGFIPFYKDKNYFGTYINFNDPIIDRYFFRDLEKPILATDVYSQYQLEYLNDNVRKSEWVGRENHIYLHYSNWKTFCSYLSCLKWKELLADKKIVILIEKEIAKYPIDFKKEYNLDYSQYPVKPVGIREINRLIWHTQLATHNGGDFFNEILYDHPNLLVMESIFFDKLKNLISNFKKTWKKTEKVSSTLLAELNQLRHPTDKDFLVAIYLNSNLISGNNLGNERIVPAILFQPHFPNVRSQIKLDNNQNVAVISSNQYEEVYSSPLFQKFKYIKTFTPIRRITTSYGASIRFVYNNFIRGDEETLVTDFLTNLLLNRSLWVDKWDRLYRDSVSVRFEDGKLNPKATFTALAEFLDIPYTETMTYCSGHGGINPESMEGNVRGFDLDTVYRTYDDYTDDSDRAILEYFFRDVYQAYGYDFHYYKGEAVDMNWVKDKLNHIQHINQFIVESHEHLFAQQIKDGTAIIEGNYQGDISAIPLLAAQKRLEQYHENRLNVMETLLSGLHFVNQNGQPLQLMKLLQLDPALLEQPLYH